jgi:hypothetical protein
MRKNFFKCIEKAGIKPSPHAWMLQILPVATVPVVAFVWKQPPCHAKTHSSVFSDQPPEDRQLHVIANISDVAILH